MEYYIYQVTFIAGLKRCYVCNKVNLLNKMGFYETMREVTVFVYLLEAFL